MGRKGSPWICTARQGGPPRTEAGLAWEVTPVDVAHAWVPLQGRTARRVRFFLEQAEQGLLSHHKQLARTRKHCLSSVIKANVVLSVSLDCHLRLFNMIEAAGVGTCGFFNSDFSSANIILTLALGGKKRIRGLTVQG